MQQISLYDRMVAERLHAVGDCLPLVGDGHTMVLRGRRMVFVVFSSGLPIVSGTGRGLFRDPVAGLSETSQ